MNPHRVVSKEELENDLKAKGFQQTDRTTDTGTVWKSTQTGKHLIVPHPYEGMYPEFILRDLRERMTALGQRVVH